MESSHWERAYAGGDTGRSWYQEHAEVSVRLITAQRGPADAVVDVGAGASTLVDDLLALGYADVTVLDLAATGLELARRRLGARADEVAWLVEDVLAWAPARRYHVWHDRALLHFLTDPADRVRYRDTLLAATDVGSLIVLGVFGPAGPERCSGLPVIRMNGEQLAALLGARFRVLETFTQTHRTPSGGLQQFTWLSAVRASA